MNTKNKKVILGRIAAMMTIPVFIVLLMAMPGVMAQSSDKIIEVSQPAQITTSDRYERNPSVFKMGNTYWVFFVRANSTGSHDPDDGYNPDTDSYHVYYTTSTDNGATWSSPTKVDNASTGQRGMAAFVDHTGKIWVFVSSPGASDIKYTTSTDNGATWSSLTDTGYDGSHVDAFEDSENKIWVFYEDGGTGIEAIKSSDGGSTWTHVTNISPSPNDGIPKAMEADGKLYVVWCNWNAGGKAWYTNSTNLTGESWASATELVDVPGTTMCDPVLVKKGSEYILFYAPWNQSTNAQWIEVMKTVDVTNWPSSGKKVTNGGYGTTHWWDMWPEVLVDGSELYLFYGSEKNGAARADGNLFMFKVDWDLTHNHFEAIQPAIDSALPGGTVLVHDGTYTEQLIINKSLTLQSASSPKIVAPDTRTTYTFSESSRTWDPIIFAYGGIESGGAVSGSGVINVNITGFVIDGEDKTPNGRFTAILYRNVEGEISNNVIKNMTINSQETFGIVVYGDSNVTISNNNVSGYARGGIGVNGDCGSAPDPTAIIIGNTVTGPGMGVPVTWAPNGIQIAWGATGTIKNNTVTGNGWPGTNWTGTGILVGGGSHNVNVIENEVYNDETGIAVFGAGVWGCPGGNNSVVSDNLVRDNEYGISVQMDAHNTSVMRNLVMNNNHTGIDVSNFWNYEPTGTGIHYNIIVGNGDYGVWNYKVSHLVDATNNWWGANDGPSGQGPGSGDNVSANVTYDPWIVLYVNADPPSIVADGSSTSTITADMTRNSNGVDTSAQGHIPDGTEIIFTTDKGSIGSSTTTKATTSGKATATLTSSTTQGTATVNASAPPYTNAATNSTTVVFTALSTPTPTPTPAPRPVPAITPLGFIVALVSLFGLAAVAMREMYKR